MLCCVMLCMHVYRFPSPKPTSCVGLLDPSQPCLLFHHVPPWWHFPPYCLGKLTLCIKGAWRNYIIPNVTHPVLHGDMGCLGPWCHRVQSVDMSTTSHRGAVIPTAWRISRTTSRPLDLGGSRHEGYDGGVPLGLTPYLWGERTAKRGEKNRLDHPLGVHGCFMTATCGRQLESTMVLCTGCVLLISLLSFMGFWHIGNT